MPKQLKRKFEGSRNGSPTKKILGSFNLNDFTLPSSDDEVLVTVNVRGKKTFYYKSYMCFQTACVSDFVLAKCMESTCPAWGIVIRNDYYVCNFHNHEADQLAAEMQLFVTMLEQLSLLNPRRTPESLFKSAIKKTNLQGILFRLPPLFKESMLCARRVPSVYQPVLYKFHAIPIDVRPEPSGLTAEHVLGRLQDEIYKSNVVPSLSNLIYQPDPTNQPQQSEANGSLQSPEDLQRFLSETAPDGSQTILVLQNPDLQPQGTAVVNTPECVERAMRSYEGNNVFILDYAEPDMAESFVSLYNSIHRPGTLQNQGNLAVAGTSSGTGSTLADSFNNSVDLPMYSDNCVTPKDTMIFRSPTFSPDNVLACSDFPQESVEDQAVASAYSDSSNDGVRTEVSYNVEYVGLDSSPQNLVIDENTLSESTDESTLSENTDESLLETSGNNVIRSDFLQTDMAQRCVDSNLRDFEHTNPTDFESANPTDFDNANPTNFDDDNLTDLDNVNPTHFDNANSTDLDNANPTDLDHPNYGSAVDMSLVTLKNVETSFLLNALKCNEDFDAVGNNIITSDGDLSEFYIEKSS